MDNSLLLFNRSQRILGGCHMVQIRRGGIEDFSCTHCGAAYEISETPARDTGSAACEVCDMIMMKWVDSAIPIFRARKSVETARRRYFFSSHSHAAGG
jgi:hypothetical protein